MPDASPLETVLKRDRLVVAAGLVILTLIAAGYTVLGVGMPMSAYDMTRMAGRMVMTAPVWTPGYFLLVFLMWWVMMIAMMTPAAAPVILLHAALGRRGGGTSAGLGSTVMFVSGYLVAWAGFSLAAATAQWALELNRIVDSSEMAFVGRMLAGAVLVAAGVYQFTPLKHTCLAHCRSPIHFLVEHRRTGHAGAFLMGLEHGSFCLGCCWVLMVLLFVGGIMNLNWIAGLALYVLAEKVLPHGHRISRAAGVVLVVWGAWLVATGPGLV